MRSPETRNRETIQTSLPYNSPCIKVEIGRSRSWGMFMFKFVWKYEVMCEIKVMCEIQRVVSSRSRWKFKVISDIWTCWCYSERSCWYDITVQALSCVSLNFYMYKLHSCVIWTIIFKLFGFLLYYLQLWFNVATLEQSYSWYILNCQTRYYIYWSHRSALTFRTVQNDGVKAKWSHIQGQKS